MPHGSRSRSSSPPFPQPPHFQMPSFGDLLPPRVEPSRLPSRSPPPPTSDQQTVMTFCSVSADVAATLLAMYNTTEAAIQAYFDNPGHFDAPAPVAAAAPAPAPAPAPATSAYKSVTNTWPAHCTASRLQRFPRCSAEPLRSTDLLL
jgi:hypothetical protein